MPCCVVRGCKNHERKVNKKHGGISYHRFPTDPVREEIWSRILRKQRKEPYFKPHKDTRLCSAHFCDKDVYTTRAGLQRLKGSAIPQLKIEPDPPQTIPLPDPSPGDESEVDDDDSIYERDVSPIRTEDEGEATVPEGSSRRHEGCRCDVCRAHIVGFRYACVECANFDLCGACEARAHHAHHYVLRVPASKLQSDVRAVIQKIREQLLKDGDIKEEKDDTIGEDSIKIEIMEEDLKQEDPLEETAEPCAGPLQGAGGQDVQYEESEDSTAVKFLGLSEGGRLPVIELPLSHQPAVPQVLSHQPQVLTHQPQVLSHQPAVSQVLYHRPKVLTHQPAVLSRQPKDQVKVQSKRKVLSHQPAVPQVLSHEPQIPHATSHEKRPQLLEVQCVDTVRVLERALGATEAPGGGDCSGGKAPGEEGSYAVYTHHADPSHSSQDVGAQSEEPIGAGDETKPSRKKRKK